MPEYRAPVDDMLFLLRDVFKLSEFCEAFPQIDELDDATAGAILEEAAKVSEQVLYPIDVTGDREGCTWCEGKVTAPQGFVEAYQVFSEGGWGALGGNAEYGGMGMPKLLVSAVEEMVQGANMAFGLAPMLTAGACLALQTHGSDELKNKYLPKMYSGEWSGAMDLTEAHAGTDLGLMRSKAKPLADGSYLLSGSKIFITWGEHDMAENIVHLVLAKLPDAPEGSKGISLFLVPKYLSGDSGMLAEANGVSCGSIEHKMGIHGSATCVMNFDQAKAWLVGEPHQGLACMFTMMNYERLVVGIQGVGLAEASYQTARNYALERLQGRATNIDEREDGPADPIIVHPDVRRMLLEMKSLTEASRAFYMYVASCLDRAKFSEATEQKTLAEQQVALLTPVAKAFLTDRAFDVCVLGQQVLGGHGYIQEWGQEQHVRDARITQIYEGTNGVQAMDLIGRKTVVCKGELLQVYSIEIRETCERANTQGLDSNIVAQMLDALDTLEALTEGIVNAPSSEHSGAVACDYLDVMGYVSLGYMWIKIVLAAQESSSTLSANKIKTARFYFAKILPQIRALAARIESGDEALLAFEREDF